MKKFLVISCLAVFGVMSAAASSFSQQKEQNYWAAFKAGSWALYDMGGGMEQKQTLIKKTNTEIILKAELTMDGKVISSSEAKIPAVASAETKADSQTEVSESDEKIEVKNRTLACRVYEFKDPKGTSKTWVSKEVPGGVVKIISGDNIAMTLKDFEAK